MEPDCVGNERVCFRFGFALGVTTLMHRADSNEPAVLVLLDYDGELMVHGKPSLVAVDRAFPDYRK